MWITSWHDIPKIMLEIGLPGCIVAAALYLCYWLFTRKKQQVSRWMHLLRYSFAVYLVSLLLLTMSPGASNGALIPNLHPFSTVQFAIESDFSTAKLQVVLNILLFTPLGILLPNLLPCMRKGYATVLGACCLTLGIELIQMLLPSRVFDIDDILLNTLGGAIGWAVYALWMHFTHRREQSAVGICAALGIAAILPLFLVWNTLSTAFQPYPDPFSYQPVCPDEIQLSQEALDTRYPEKAAVYYKKEQDTKVAMQQLMDQLGMYGILEETERGYRCSNGTQTLVYDNDRWDYTLRQTDHTPAIAPDESLRQTALAFFADLAFDPEAWEFSHISNLHESTTPESGPQAIDIDPVTGEEILPENMYISGKAITFSLKKQAEAMGLITFFADSKGIYEITCLVEPFKPVKEEELCAPEEAVDRLCRNNQCSVLLEDWVMQPSKMTVESISLEYTHYKGYNLPIWVLQGTFEGTDGDGNAAVTTGSIEVSALQ